MNRRFTLRRLVTAALFLALAYVIPFLTGQIPEIGSKLCPMHIPVLLCGFICGHRWGLAVGFTAPLIRSLTLGVPILFPSAVCMAFEIGVYGLTAGLTHKLYPRKRPNVYLSLLTAMIAGRLVWGIAMFICLAASGGAFTLTAFLSGAFTNAIPGIIAQIVLIPPIVMAAETHLPLAKFADVGYNISNNNYKDI